jgi:hypothetical protein
MEETFWRAVVPGDFKSVEAVVMVQKTAFQNVYYYYCPTCY